WMTSRRSTPSHVPHCSLLVSRAPPGAYPEPSKSGWPCSARCPDCSARCGRRRPPTARWSYPYRSRTASPSGHGLRWPGRCDPTTAPHRSTSRPTHFGWWGRPPASSATGSAAHGRAASTTSSPRCCATRPPCTAGIPSGWWRRSPASTASCRPRTRPGPGSSGTPSTTPIPPS
ncbi:MAG: hypothetical protein AVDCRST_MAG54-1307, partial [uncultured Actinomycetospora sp.]